MDEMEGHEIENSFVTNLVRISHMSPMCFLNIYINYYYKMTNKWIVITFGIWESTTAETNKMFKYVCLLLVVKSVLCGNLVEVLKTDGESKLIKYVTAAGLADAILGGKRSVHYS